MVSLKIARGNQMRRLQEATKWTELDDQVRRLFHVSEGTQLSLTWLDADGDTITCSSQSDLDEALGHANEQKWSTLRLHVQHQCTDSEDQEWVGISDPGSSHEETGGAEEHKEERETKSGHKPLSIKKLKHKLDEAAIDYSDCLTKEDLVEKLSRLVSMANSCGVSSDDSSNNSGGGGEVQEHAKMLQGLHRVMLQVLPTEEMQHVLDVLQQYFHAHARAHEQKQEQHQQDGRQDERLQAHLEHLQGLLLHLVESLLKTHPTLVPPLQQALRSEYFRRLDQDQDETNSTHDSTNANDNDSTNANDNGGWDGIPGIFMHPPPHCGFKSSGFPFPAPFGLHHPHHPPLFAGAFPGGFPLPLVMPLLAGLSLPHLSGVRDFTRSVLHIIRAAVENNTHKDNTEQKHDQKHEQQHEPQHEQKHGPTVYNSQRASATASEVKIRVVQAWYGAPSSPFSDEAGVDVTDIVEGLVRKQGSDNDDNSNGDTITAGERLDIVAADAPFNTLFGDPVPGMPKVLLLRYICRGASNNGTGRVEVQEASANEHGGAIHIPNAPTPAPAVPEPVFRGAVYTAQYDDEEQEREQERLLQMALEESLAVSAQ